MVFHILGSLAQCFNFVSLNVQVLNQSNNITWSGGYSTGIAPVLINRDSNNYEGESYNHYQLDSNVAESEYYYISHFVSYSDTLNGNADKVIIGSSNAYLSDDFGDPFVYTATINFTSTPSCSVTLNRPYTPQHLVNAEILVNIIPVLTGQYDSFESIYPIQFSFPLWTNQGFTPQSYTILNYPQPDLYGYYIYTSIHIVEMDIIRQYYENVGYDEGYDIGFVEGEGSGYQTGYNVGYGEGYNVGQSSSNSFRNLLATIIDTPILYLRKMFDYELFGISVFQALATVISIIVALAVFRLVRGIF